MLQNILKPVEASEKRGLEVSLAVFVWRQLNTV